jgi:hypothetical protein
VPRASFTAFQVRAAATFGHRFAALFAPLLNWLGNSGLALTIFLAAISMPEWLACHERRDHHLVHFNTVSSVKNCILRSRA